MMKFSMVCFVGAGTLVFSTFILSLSVLTLMLAGFIPFAGPPGWLAYPFLAGIWLGVIAAVSFVIAMIRSEAK